jgi:hypothetical protein
MGIFSSKGDRERIAKQQEEVAEWERQAARNRKENKQREARFGRAYGGGSRYGGELRK